MTASEIAEIPGMLAVATEHSHARQHALLSAQSTTHPCEQVARMPLNQLLYHALIGLLSPDGSQPV